MDPAGEALGLTSSGHGGCSEHSERQELRQPEAARGRARPLEAPGPAWPGLAQPGPAQQACFCWGLPGLVAYSKA